MVKEIAWLSYDEDKLNKLIGKFEDEQESDIYKEARMARKNIFRY